MAEVEEPRQEEANATKLQMSKDLFFVWLLLGLKPRRIPPGNVVKLSYTMPAQQKEKQTTVN